MQQKIHFDDNLSFRSDSSEIIFIPGLCDDGIASWFESNFEKLCEILDDAQSGYFNLVHLSSRIKKYLTSEYNSFYNPTTENDILVALAEAREDAALEATAKALAEGKAEGIAEGEAKGKAEVARAMLAKNSPIDFITSVTGLTKAQVQSIAQSL